MRVEYLECSRERERGKHTYQESADEKKKALVFPLPDPYIYHRKC